ncbi:hypothetical protein MMC25_000574 [Agyrium rufum]|nr:hypothetical protein [Agyrium rufum]
MAFVQSAPVMAQGGGSIIPPNLSKAHVQEIFQKYTKMKESGVPETDPEFKQAHSLLISIQQQSKLQMLRQEQQKQQVQQQEAIARQHRHIQQHSQNAANGHGTNAAGINGAAPTPTKPPMSAPPSDAGATPTPTSKQPGQAQKPPVQSANTFTPEQMNTLRNQILAFKLLSKNNPIPPQVHQQLFPQSQAKRPSSSGQALATATAVLETATRPAANGAPVSSVPETRHTYDHFNSPYAYLSSTISYADHATRARRVMIPSIMPSGVDVDRVREEREKIIYNRIMARKAELENLPANLAVWDTSESDMPKANDKLKLKALIEYKMLCLLPKQRSLRQQVSREMILNDNLAQTANRSLYRRNKKQTLREARITEKLEKQQRDARETKEKQKQVDHIQAILSHAQELHKNAQTQKARKIKLGRLMQQQHQHIEKEEQKRVERTAKQRLQALKANDEETYLKLLGQAKDSRISHLLKQTDGFLSQLAASVKAQQRNAVERYGGEQEPVEEDISDSEDEDNQGPKVDYYQVAHRIKEEVKKQPGILVGGTLKEYQIKGLQWMISLYNNNLNGILADEMGLGKTIQTISLITYLIETKKQNGPFLVIVPLSTLTNWNLEFDKWAPSVSKIVYKGPPNTRRQQQGMIRQGQFQVLLTTYEYIIRDRPVLSKIKWIHMIVDEGHRMKNASSKLSNTLTQYYNTRFRLILTGTPLQNNLPELWALLNFVLPAIFKSVKSFDEWFNTPFANTGGQDKMELTEEEQLLVIRRLHKVLRPFLLRRLKKDVEKDLPNKTEKVIKCRFSALQAKLYKQLVTYNKMSVSDGKGGKTGMRGLSNMLMQLRKLCNHPFVFEQVEEQMNPEKGTNDLLWRTAGKFELLDRILPKFQVTGHRILMFFQMTMIMNIMEDFLRLRGMKYLRLDGTTKSDDRSELLRLFNAPNSPYFCFLLSTRAGGLGLNLQTADTVIIYDSDWNPHQDLQAQDRAHRIGQKNEVRILRLISSNSVEEKILERAQFKLDMDGKVIQAGKFDNKSTNEEREAMLRTLLDSAEAADQLGDQEEMDDDELNAIMARSDNEIVVFQQLDEERARDPIYGMGKKMPRLMAENELPDIYLQEDNPVTEEIEEIAGRGARERTRVKYDDGLTEEQWLMAVDDDEDTLEAAIARKNARIEKRQTNKEKRAKAANAPDSSPEPSRQSSEEPPPPKQKGKRKSMPPKRKREEEELPKDTPPAKKRGRWPAKVAESLSPTDRSKLQKILNKVFSQLMGMEVEVPPDSSDEEGASPEMRPIIDPFVKLVPKNHYPDYYVIIQKPIAMENIQKKINKQEYQSLKDFFMDVKLLCNNARTFNEDGSLLFQDANDIEAACLTQLKAETASLPEWQDFEDSSTATPQNGFATTNGSSTVGTPAPPAFGNVTANGTKLKLTFNGGANGS